MRSAVLISLTLMLLADLGLAITYDFEKGMDDWTPISGDWKVEKGELVQKDASTPAMRALVGDENWTDYTIECKIMITNGSYTGVIFRAISDKKYYVFYMNANGNVVELWQHIGPGDTDRIMKFKHAPQGGVRITRNEWYNFKLVIKDKSGEFYVNDELQDQTDSLEYDKGKVGAWAWATEVHFDDFTISGPGIPSETPVRLAGKTPLTWGELKSR
ncbi:TPA: DUF1080 domain-containing protein [Candidatus Poribacteria bacterium]|nr:DUF1080 domain-containing protein [Candidatus Poribacteria bacterium]HEX29561.1 DUF1080 domain-containing protein [Candidatus Poribacteria bacterium]